MQGKDNNLNITEGLPQVLMYPNKKRDGSGAQSREGARAVWGTVWGWV